jgi:CDP-diacylglycerol--serine O-phosphatidyltransferase
MASFPRLQSDNEPAPAMPPQQQHQGIKKGLYLIPSLFTAANIAMGFYAVMSALRGFQLVGNGAEIDLARETFDNAAKAIGWAMLFDTLDGRIARMTKTTTEIGVQLDSLADVLTFGIAPAVLAYAWGYGSALKEGTDAHQLGWFLSFMYLMCGAFRLARFNVQATRPRPLSEGTVKLDKHSFIGLPIPMSAALLAAIVHFAPTPLMQYGPHLAQIYSGLLMVLVACLSVLMVSTLRYSSFKQVGTGRGSTRLVILMVAAVGMLIWLYSRYVLLTLVAVYVLHGMLFRLGGIFRRSPDKEKT